MVRIITGICFVFLAAVASEACAEIKALKIGVILGLTGPAASMAQAAKNGIELAYTTLHKEDNDRITFIFEDDGLEARRSVNAAKKLISIDHVDGLIAWSSGTAMAVAPLAEQHRLPLIAIASDPAITKNRKYSFIYWATPEDESALLLPCMIKRGATKIGFVTLTHPGALAVKDSLVSAIKGSQASVHFDLEILPDQKDFTTLIHKIKQYGDSYNALVPTLFPGQLALFLKQLRQAGVTTPLYGFEVFDDREEIKASAGSMEGVVFVTAKESSETFSALYKKTYPAAINYSADTSYDAANLLIRALRSTSPVSYLEHLEAYEGAAGVVSSTSDHRFRLPVTLKRVQDGVSGGFSCTTTH